MSFNWNNDIKIQFRSWLNAWKHSHLIFKTATKPEHGYIFVVWDPKLRHVSIWRSIATYVNKEVALVEKKLNVKIPVHRLIISFDYEYSMYMYIIKAIKYHGMFYVLYSYSSLYFVLAPVPASHNHLWPTTV